MLRKFCASRAQWKLTYIAETQPKLARFSKKNAEIAQLVEHNLAKVGVASSSLVFRSKIQNQGHLRMTFIMENNLTRYNYICSRSLTETAFFFIYRSSTHL